MRLFRAVSLLLPVSIYLLLSIYSYAATPDRVTGVIDSRQMVRLVHGVSPKAQPQYDRGRVGPSLKLNYVTLLTVPTASQQRALDRLLEQQQDPSSPLYHKWLTPEVYADRFGLSPRDVQKTSRWLQSQGFSIVRVARARNFIVFRGSAAQMEATFQTEIHNFEDAQGIHFSNTTPPAIPAALSGVVSGIRGLNNFPLKSQTRRIRPDYTFKFQNSNTPFIAPGDIWTIYDLNPLYSAGFDGTGQTLAVIGETGLFQSDLADFRTAFGLSPISCTTDANDIITDCNTSNFQYRLVNGTPQDVYNDPNGRDDLPEADLDIEWSGAAAPNAQVIYVTANDPAGNGVYDSILDAIDNAVAPVITLSYTAPCELFEIGFFDSDESLLKAANSFGITVLNSSGDTGAAECDYGGNFAEFGYAVGYPASSKYVTGVGGTMIPVSEWTSTYFNTTNDANGGSAKSYIPEFGWNDPQEWGVLCTPANPCDFNGFTVTDWASAQNFFGIVAGGGGVSNCVTADVNFVCLSGFPRPPWQAGLNANAVNPGGIGELNAATPTRYSPDVSLLASVYFPGYLVCTAQSALGGAGNGSACANGISSMLNGCFAGTGPCSIFGGTSVSSPVFAGIVAVLNQYLGGTGLGNINAKLYSLAATPANGAFHSAVSPSPSLTVGSNGAFCDPGQPSLEPAPLRCPSSGPNAGFLGFDATNFDPTTGFNLVTGLGSVDANNLALAWAASRTASTTLVSAAPTNPVLGQNVTLTATVTPAAATGTVSFFNNGSTTALGTGTLNSSGVATFQTTGLPVGTDNITATYTGDGYNKPSTTAVAAVVTVSAPDFTLHNTGSTTVTVLAGITGSGYSFTVAPVAPATTFGATVTFACSGLDTTTSCVFNPASIAAGTPGSPAVSVSMTITTLGPNTVTAPALHKPRAANRSPWLPLTLPIAGIVMVGLVGRKVSRYSVFAGLCVSLALLGLLIACGGSSRPVDVTAVNPAAVSLWPNNTGWPLSGQSFTATVTNTSNTAVNWSISPSTAGSIDAVGTYTAPNVAAGLPSTVTVTATSQADPSKSNTATVNLKTATVPQTFNVTVTVTESTTNHALPPFTLTVQ